jgi:hypothetical protein
MNYYITYFEIAAFLSSLIAWPVTRKSKYMRWFPLLLFVVISVEMYETFFSPVSRYYNSMVYNVQVPLQHLLYFIILKEAIDGKAYKKILMWAMVMFAVFTLLTTLFYTRPGYFNVLAYCLGAVVIIAGILIKFYEMLQNPIDFNFLKIPFFYILFAYLIFLVGTLPYFTMGNWLHYIRHNKEVQVVLANVMSVLNYTLYTTYTFAFIWILRKKEFS